MLSPEQKAIRLTGIGGSEIGAIAGLNPWMKPIDVYRIKVEGLEVEDNSAMERGRFLERGVADWYAHRKGVKLRTVGTIVDRRNKLVVCTPDFLARSEAGAEIDLSIKVPGRYAFLDWGKDGTDDIPESYIAQAQWELVPLEDREGITESVVAAPIDGDLRTYPVKADHDLQGMLITAAERFWHDHVLPKRPPPPDGSESYSRHLRARFPSANKVTIAAPAEAEKWAEAWLRADTEASAAEERRNVARQRLEALIGEASAMNGQGFRLSYSYSRGKPKTDWERICLEAKVPEALVEQHTSRTPYRAFRLTDKEAFNG